MHVSLVIISAKAPAFPLSPPAGVSELQILHPFRMIYKSVAGALQFLEGDDLAVKFLGHGLLPPAVRSR